PTPGSLHLGECLLIVRNLHPGVCPPTPGNLHPEVASPPQRISILGDVHPPQGTFFLEDVYPPQGISVLRLPTHPRESPSWGMSSHSSVSDLGLGYESDETVLFRYCSGTCEAAVRSYDLSLKSMRSRRKIRKEKIRARPCCRPLAYDDDVSFLDAYNRYYTVNELSAKECGCV
uniref:Neurturin n=1 Tax=Zosterops lateralis melanops TaxID=1220523 RepID=A0A8D2P6I6_ZOSLA